MTKRQKMERVIAKMLETNIALMDFYKDIAPDDKAKKVCDKSIRQSKRALKVLTSINHDEIVCSLYNSLVSGKESMFVIVSALICSKQTKIWDTTKKGFQEFISLEKQGLEDERKEKEEKAKEQEAIAKAKAEGKQIDYIVDPTTKKLKAVVREEA